ncbi:hypothetical protein [Enterobacter ludwigii]|nr:hypothetical protein [Enterobacter ludwigii]MCM7369018.1 hypothetical protein [Enterobacter ludwigii]
MRTNARKPSEPDLIDDDLLESLEEEALSEAEGDSDASGDESDGSV